MFSGHAEPQSLLFDFETEEERSEIPQPASDVTAIGEHIAMLMSPRAFYEARLLSDVRQFKAAVLKEDGRHDIVVLATKLAAVGYDVAIRTAVGGGTGQQCFRNLHHVFLVIFWEGKQLIVEPQFRAQFCICNTTPQYKALVQSLPDEWVGNQAAVKPLVRLLCTQMALAFESFETATPPWRQQSSIISKWLPAKKMDRNINAEMASPRAGCSPTSTLALPDSSSDSEADSSKADSSKAAEPQRKSLDLLFRSDSVAQQGRTASDTWQIPSAMTQQPQPAEAASGHRKTASGVQTSASQQPVLGRKMPRQQNLGPRVANHEPSSTTTGFTVRQSLTAPGSDAAITSSVSRPAAAAAEKQHMTQQSAAASWARAQPSRAQPASKVQLRKLAADGHGASKPVSGSGGQQQQQEQAPTQQPGLFDLGLARRSASATKLARPATRRDFLGQPAIHTVKLGRAH